MHVEEVSCESIPISESIYHYYVEVNVSKCEVLDKGFAFGLCSDPSSSSTKAKLTNLIVVTLKLSLWSSNHVSCFFLFLLKAPCKLVCYISREKLLIDYLKYIMMTFDAYVCALEYKLTHKKTIMEK